MTRLDTSEFWQTIFVLALIVIGITSLAYLAGLSLAGIALAVLIGIPGGLACMIVVAVIFCIIGE